MIRFAGFALIAAALLWFGGSMIRGDRFKSNNALGASANASERTWNLAVCAVLGLTGAGLLIYDKNSDGEGGRFL